MTGGRAQSGTFDHLENVREFFANFREVWFDRFVRSRLGNVVVGQSAIIACRSILICAFAALFAGCGGTKILKEPIPVESPATLARVSNEQVEVALEWVIVRDGPGTWARNADWDQYQFRVVNNSDSELLLTSITVVDSLGMEVFSQRDRADLVRSSRKTVKRYRDVADLRVKAGVNAGVMVAGGAALYYAAAAVVTPSLMTGFIAGSSTAAATTTAAAGAITLVPVLIVGGVIRASNNGNVSEQIELRSGALPIGVKAGSEKEIDLFYPLAPSPRGVRIRYTIDSVLGELTIDTSDILYGLHLESIEAVAIE